MADTNETKKPEMVHIKINNIPVEVPAGTMVLAAAKKIGIDIPHLCYHPDQAVKAKCRICSAEVKGSRKLSASCTTVVMVAYRSSVTLPSEAT